MENKDVGFLAVGAVGAALMILFTGAGVILAVGNSVPTEFWAAASSLSGALIGLLAPQPATKGRLRRRAAEQQDLATTMVRDPSDPTAGPEAATTMANVLMAKAASSDVKKVDVRVVALFVVGLLAFGGGIVLALKVGAHTPAQVTAYDTAVKNVADTLIALGSGAAGALVGLLAPSVGQTRG
jgi:hypothetical protein